MSKSYRDGTLDYDTNAVSDASGVKCEDPSLAVQDWKHTDINEIVKNFGVTGQVPQIPVPPQLDMFVEPMDYRECLDAIRAADGMFASFPADVRSKFENDPAKFLDYMHEPGHEDELRKMGLMIPKEEPEAPPSEVPATS